MHGHESEVLEVVSTTGAVIGAALLAVLLFAAGALPIPVGYERGKIKWVMWCGTGMHAHHVYWWGGGDGFQTLHPADRSGRA